MAFSAAGKDPATDEEFLTALYKGGELLAAGKVVEAKDHLELAFKLHPKNEKAQNLLGLTYFKLGLFDRASEIYELLVRDNPVDPTLRVNLGLVYLKSNNLPRATREFETATDLEPTHKKAHNYLGLALAQAGEYAKAREHFLAADSAAMAEKMERAMQGGAAPPASVPLASDTEQAAAAAATGDGSQMEAAPPEIHADVVPADAVSVESASSEGSAEQVAPAGGNLTGDWGAHFGGNAQPGGDEMRFAEDEGPSAASLDAQVQPTSEAAVAVGAQVPVEVAQGGSWEQMPMVEASAEEVMVEVAVESAAATNRAANGGGEGGLQVTSGWSDGQGVEVVPTAQPVAVEPEIVSDAGVNVEVEPASAEAMASDAAPAEEQSVDMFPGDPPPSDAAAAALAWAQQGEEGAAQQGDWGAAAEAGSGDPSWLTEQQAQAQAYGDAGGEPAPMSEMQAMADATASDASTGGGSYDEAGAPVDGGQAYSSSSGYAVETAGYADGQGTQQFGQEQMQAQGAGGAEPQGYAASEPMPAADGQWAAGDGGAMAEGATAVAAATTGFAPMEAPRLEALGPSLDWSSAGQALGGPFNLSTEGLALSVNGEILARMPGLLAVAGSVDATPEMKRSRGRSTEQPFGEGLNQLQRVKGNGVVYLEPGASKYQAITLADEGAYVREERVFAFEESVGFENARLTGQGNIGVDVVHLKGQGTVLLKLDGALKAIAIPAGTPLKVPLARLVGWYGHISVRVMGFVGQGAVELTGDGYALLAA